MTTSVSSSTNSTVAPTTAASTAALSSPGIGSGLDVTSIVQQLMAVEQAPLTALQTTASSYQADLSAYSTIQGAMSGLQIAAQGLANPANLNTISASVGNSSLLTATAGANALAGSYSVEVKTLATSQKLVSTGFADTTSAVGAGTITLQFGTYNSSGNTFTVNTKQPSGSVTIDPTDDSLAGIASAINSANLGVTATILNDGSGATANRLVITSNSTGTSNSVRVLVNDSDGNNTDASGLSQLAYDPTAAAGSGQNLSQTVAATDATLNIDGVAVTKPSNIITDAIQGVTLNLTAANPGSPTTVTLASDSSGLQSDLSSFVSAYNTLNSTMASLTAFDASSNTAGQLQGDPTAQNIETRIRSVLSQALPSGALTTLDQVGLGFQSDGSLTLDTTTLNSAISANPNAIASLFAAIGTPSDNLVSFSASSAATQVGSYSVYISQLATHGSATGSTAANTTITAGANDTLTLNVDGTPASVTIPAGSYTADSLAQQLQTQINGLSVLSSTGISVAVSQNAGVLSITSQSYGSASSVNITGGNGNTALFGAISTTAGLDVAGTINGSPATGQGQTLTGAAGTPAEGLALQINGGATGNRGTVNFTRGFADQINTFLNGYVGSSGLLQSATDGISAQVQLNTQQQTSLQAHLTALQAQYMAEFTALDTSIASMNTTSSFLTQQFNAIEGITAQTTSSNKG